MNYNLAVKYAKKPTPLEQKLHSLKDEFVEAAQREYDAWDASDPEFGDGDVGFGGICHNIAENIGEVLDKHGIDYKTQDNNGMGEQHVWVTAHDDKHAYDVDIHPNHYETGGGYTWQKIPNVKFTPNHIDISEVPREYLDLDNENYSRCYTKAIVTKYAKPIKAELVEHPYHNTLDGITYRAVHPETGRALPTFNHALAERGAVSQSLQRMGYHDTDLAKRSNKVNHFVSLVRNIVKAQPELDAVQKYKDRARLLNEGNITEEDSEYSPGNKEFHVHDVTGLPGFRLTNVVEPLVRYANQILIKHNPTEAIRPSSPKLHIAAGTSATEPFTDINDKDVVGDKADIDPHWLEIDGVPYHPTDHEAEVNPTIKPANIEDQPIKLASPTFAKQLAELEAERTTKQSTEKGLPLAKVKGESKAKWTDIAKWKAGGLERSKILQHLQKTYYLSKSNAAATLRRFNVAQARKNQQPPQKFARPNTNPVNSVGDLSPVAYGDKDIRVGGMGGGKSKSSVVRVDPQIANTALALHLLDASKHFHKLGDVGSAALALHALAGTSPKGVNGDPYAELGNRLAAVKHPLATTYNWHKVNRGLAVDHFIEKQLLKHVTKPEGMSDAEYWTRLSSYGSDKSTKNQQELLRRLKDAASKSTYTFPSASHFTDEKLKFAINRITDRKIEQEYVKQQKSKTGHSKLGKLRDVLHGYLASVGKHLKFSKAYSTIGKPFLSISEHLGETGTAVRKALADNPTDHTGHLAYADYLEENNHPAKAQFIREAVDKYPDKIKHTVTTVIPKSNESYIYSHIDPSNEHYNLIDLHNGHRVQWTIPVDKEKQTKVETALHAEGTPTSVGSPHTDLAPHRYAAYRAPEGGIVVRGTFYPAGAYVPDLQKFAATTKGKKLRKKWRKVKLTPGIQSVLNCC